MLRIIFISLISLCLLSCVSEFTPSGNFSSCSEPGYLYEELYFKGDSVKYTNQEGLISKWENYLVKEDTLFYYTPGKDKIPTYGIIREFNENNFSLYYPERNNTLVFNRIKGIAIDTENDELLLKSNQDRFFNSDCYMTESEKEKLPQF